MIELFHIFWGVCEPQMRLVADFFRCTHFQAVFATFLLETALLSYKMYLFLHSPDTFQFFAGCVREGQLLGSIDRRHLRLHRSRFVLWWAGLLIDWWGGGRYGSFYESSIYWSRFLLWWGGLLIEGRGGNGRMGVQYRVYLPRLLIAWIVFILVFVVFVKLKFFERQTGRAYRCCACKIRVDFAAVHDVMVIE